MFSAICVLATVQVYRKAGREIQRRLQGVMAQFEGYGLQPVHQSNKINVGFSPSGQVPFKLTHYPSRSGMALRPPEQRLRSEAPEPENTLLPHLFRRDSGNTRANFHQQWCNLPRAQKTLLKKDCNARQMCYYRDRSGKFSSVRPNGIFHRGFEAESSGTDSRDEQWANVGGAMALRAQGIVV